MMDSPKPKHQHIDCTLKEKLEILKHVGSMKGIDICVGILPELHTRVLVTRYSSV